MRRALAEDRKLRAEHALVAAQHPAPAEAGIEVLQAGGNVVDAAVAAVVAAADRLRQPDLAATLRALADDGPALLYTGDLGAEIVRYVQAEGGVLDRRDLAEYAPEIRPAACYQYRGFDVFTSGDDSGGGVLRQILAELDGCDTRQLDPLGPERMSAIVAAAARVWSQRLGASLTADTGCTDHLVVGDTRGNVVSITSTLQTLMGSRLTVPGTGIVLNSGMALFTDRPGKPESLEPGKKAITNMCPTVVLRDGQPILALGASGGRRIPNMVTQPLTLVLDHGWPGDRAVAAPRYHTTRGDPLLVEVGLPDETLAALQVHGHVEVKAWGSLDLGGQSPTLWFDADGGLLGAPDPRRHGAAAAW